jgi:hypothetical protein
MFAAIRNSTPVAANISTIFLSYKPEGIKRVLNSKILFIAIP